MPFASGFFVKNLIRIFHYHGFWKRFSGEVAIVHVGFGFALPSKESLRLKTACDHSTLRRDSAMLWA